jgi:hypothetical protein
MPVFTCSSGHCSRWISVSAIPGGNPTALADPERWATDYVRCAGCKRYLCDRCHRGEQCTCGGKFYRPGPEEAIAIMHGEVPAGPTAVPAAQIPSPSDGAGKQGKPWWKFWQ